MRRREFGFGDSHPIHEWLPILFLTLAPVTVIEVGKPMLAVVKSLGSSSPHAES